MGHQPGVFIPHRGSVPDVGSTRTDQREVFSPYLRGNLTPEIVRQSHLTPREVDLYVHDDRRAIKLP